MLVHWVSYKQGSQRVLLFTQSDRLAATTRLPMERAKLELCLALEKIGLSLVCIILVSCKKWREGAGGILLCIISFYYKTRC